MRKHFPQGIYIDLLKTEVYTSLISNPSRLEDYIPPSFDDWILIDEVQRIPQLLNEVHRLIEEKGYLFVLTGSSTRSLRKRGTNLLAGRALTYHMYPLTVPELGERFHLEQGLNFGHLPSIFNESNPSLYLKSYIDTYLREEVLQEGLTRNISVFTRFLEVASFSQGSVVNMSAIARECHAHRKVVESYFQIVEDLLLGVRLPLFNKRAKRKLISHPKFYFFDVGVYRFLRPKGPMDFTESIDGVAIETLIFQELRAINDYFQLDYTLYYWRTQSGLEVDFVLYGPKGMVAIEVKRTTNVSQKDMKPLLEFGKDYPGSHLFIFYGGKEKMYRNNIHFIPLTMALQTLLEIIQIESK